MVASTSSEPGGAGKPSPDSTDGRRARAERNRDAVVDAILALLDEGVERPGAAEIADRAGVSMRSVFRHFDDLESLRAAAVVRHTEQIAPLFVFVNPGGTLDDRVHALVRQRARLFEELTSVRRAADPLRGRSEAIRDGLDLARRTLNEQLEVFFASELAGVEPAARRDLLDALEVATSWSTWYQLRCEQALSSRRAAATMRLLARALLPGGLGA